MRTLVTGGNGYLGKSFGHSLRDSEDLILSYDRKVNIPNIKENYVQVQGDINDKLKIIELMKHFQIDSVVHLAALKSVTESADNAKAYFMTNVEGTKSIFEASEMCGIKNFVFASDTNFDVGTAIGLAISDILRSAIYPVKLLEAASKPTLNVAAPQLDESVPE